VKPGRLQMITTDHAGPELNGRLGQSLDGRLQRRA
jgi:hypothetical protein